MIHKPIQIKNLELSFPHKICFENFSSQIYHGSRIAIIGRNGTGKSTLLKMIAGTFMLSGGQVVLPENAVIGYVPQIIQDYSDSSGGQRLNKALTTALKLDPNILLLDEPTNHLDTRNRKGLMRMLQNFSGTLIVVSHDKELLRNCVDTIWHIDDAKINIFSGKYDDYMDEKVLKRTSIEEKLKTLKRQQKDSHNKLMQEQERASKSKAYGEKKYVKDKVALGAAKAQGQSSLNKNRAKINDTKTELSNQLASLRQPEIILPKFSIQAAEIGNQTVVQISDATVWYYANLPILSGISLILGSHQRVAITGDNGSGKTTLIKAILGEPNIFKTGIWHLLKREEIGYLDQHYSTLDPAKTVFETIADLMPGQAGPEVRRHLNDFLFRKNEEVNAQVHNLSGGEKARLTLAQIAAKTPKLLILDEVTNNLDLETREHVIQVLKTFPGAILVVSHDADFLAEIGIDQIVDVEKFKTE